MQNHPSGNLWSTEMIRRSGLVLVLSWGMMALVWSQPTQWESWFSAESAKSYRQAKKSLIRSDIPVMEAYGVLQQGPAYHRLDSTGFWEVQLPGAGKEQDFHALVHIPSAYDPAIAWPVQVMLHGGVSQPNPKGVFRFVDTASTAYDSLDYIGVYPSGWVGAPWWNERQSDHLSRLITWLKYRVNMDEDRIYLKGVSDGATGTWYQAQMLPDLWAAYGVSIGNLPGLSSLSDRQTYLANYGGMHFFMVQTVQDHLFPPQRSSLPYLPLLRDARAFIEYRQIQDAGHDLSWYPQMRDTIQAFFRSHPRDPTPDTLFWETEAPEDNGRCFWLEIDRVGKIGGDVDLPDINEWKFGPNFDPTFKRDSLSGAVSATFRANVFDISTDNVKFLSLWISPDMVDLAQPLIVNINGKERFRKMVEPKLETLLESWELIHDRKQLYVAKITFRI
ncbi:hypothetical protein [Pontibacter sp. G13]|uniref:hypothetical protein n=1 Tax=Pontibacter sp. G13 TaxID=3074898 RepID=UPI002889B0B9|nr:hypothetical protein [Pontibacter sp. G13]WNJ19403.1 hypothetical protein RJD25_02830 [Pontibacter sp. G13]